MAYGESHGAWDPTQGYTEGILGRLIDAADGGDPGLPSVRAMRDFLCGTEFADADDESRFFTSHGLNLETAEPLSGSNTARSSSSTTCSSLTVAEGGARRVRFTSWCSAIPLSVWPASCRCATASSAPSRPHDAGCGRRPPFAYALPDRSRQTWRVSWPGLKAGAGIVRRSGSTGTETFHKV
jgi:hypothetical protein